MSEKPKKDEITETPPELKPEAGIEAPLPVDSGIEPTNTPDPNSELVDILKRFMPDADLSTPEGIILAAGKVIPTLALVHDKIYDLALTSPEAASTLNDWMETGDLAKALARNYDSEEIAALVEDISDEGNEEDRNAYSEKVSKRKARETELKGNQDLSIAEIQGYMEEKGWPEEKAIEFMDKVDTFASDLFNGKITKTHLAQLEKAFNYDNDVNTALDDGKIAGRNEKIVAEKASREDIKDLLPEINEGAEVPKQNKRNRYVPTPEFRV